LPEAYLAAQFLDPRQEFLAVGAHPANESRRGAAINTLTHDRFPDYESALLFFWSAIASFHSPCKPPVKKGFAAMTPRWVGSSRLNIIVSPSPSTAAPPAYSTLRPPAHITV